MLTATVVGLGVLIAGVNVMGVWWVGVEGMGPFRLGTQAPLVHHLHGSGQVLEGANRGIGNVYAYPSREVALQKARLLGCSGVHRMGDLWMPCEHHVEP